MQKFNLFLILLSAFFFSQSNPFIVQPIIDSSEAVSNNQMEKESEELVSKERQEKIEAIKKCAKKCNLEKFKLRISELSDGVSTRELVALVPYLAQNACDGKECKESQEMMDQLVMAAMADVYKRKPHHRNKFQQTTVNVYLPAYNQ